MLSDFFRINLPYGLARNKEGKWMAFNREYLPLGYNDMGYKGSPGESYSNLPIYSKYKRIPDKLLISLADSERSIQRDADGNLLRIFLYDDASNPVNHTSDKKYLWDNYFNKLKKLSKLKV